MVSDGWTYGLVGAVLFAGGLLLLFYRDMNTMDPWYMLLFLSITVGISFLVGYVLGYLADKGLGPFSEDRE
jgi:hypothetical protein